MAYQKLAELTDKSTLQELVSFLKEKYPREKMTGFFMQLRSFRMTQSFLSIIYDRVIEDVKTDSKYWSIRAEFEYFKNEEYELNDEEKCLLNEYPKIKSQLYLDVEDWFLHAHILMEKFSKLSKLLMILTAKNEDVSKLAYELPNRSFNAHIKHFLNTKPKGLRDKKYAELLQGCKVWYVRDIKETEMI